MKLTNKFFLMLMMIACMSMVTVTCGKKKEPAKPQDCYKTFPKAVKGLKITGERSERNIIKHMVPFVCDLQELYQKRLQKKPDLKGTLELRILVEFNGEIMSYSIERTSIEDALFLKEVKHRLAFLSFDSYGPFNSETEFIYPVRFGY